MDWKQQQQQQQQQHEGIAARIKGSSSNNS